MSTNQLALVSHRGYILGRRLPVSQGRSYYNLATPTSPAAYYPAFDPISVLASLAFLAFLLQSFASLFDRSRSIIPTVVSGRKSPEEFDEISRVERRVLDALEKYADFEHDLAESERKQDDTPL